MTKTTEQMAISEHTKVTMHFSLGILGEPVIDSNFEAEPVSFNIGDDNIPAGFEKYLMGLKAGDERSFEIPPQDGFGQANPNNIQSMKRNAFAADMPIAPGLIVSFADAQNAELPGVIKQVEADEVIVDFNHPLASKTLEFKVKILEVAHAD